MDPNSTTEVFNLPKLKDYTAAQILPFITDGLSGIGKV
jgi:hypothetical protein